MSATDELHGQLDTGYPHTLRADLHKALMARGIDYRVTQGITFWNRDDGCECLAYGYQVDGVPKLAIKVVGFTDPEQAVAATLGQGTCQDLGGTGANDEQVFSCSECGCVLSLYDRDGSNNLCTSFVFDYPRYCPECGRKVVSDGFCAWGERKVVDARAVPPEVVSDGETDGATGYCRCGACGEPIDPWDHFCRHCGTGVAR